MINEINEVGRDTAGMFINRNSHVFANDNLENTMYLMKPLYVNFDLSELEKYEEDLKIQHATSNKSH